MPYELISVDDHIIEPPTVWTDRLKQLREYSRATFSSGRCVSGSGEPAMLTEMTEKDWSSRACHDP